MKRGAAFAGGPLPFWTTMNNNHLLSTYKRLPVSFTHGRGAWLWDEAGKAYLDALCGIAVTGLGHAHPDVTRAVTTQAERLLHCSNLYRIPAQERLGERLSELAGMDGVFFCNSGAEANETAIKLARLHGARLGIAAPCVVVMEDAFHGRTLATLAATGNAKAQAGFEPLPAGFIRVPYGDEEALRRLEDDRGIAAVLVEPVQGEGGIRVAPAGYLKALRALCDERGWLLMLDEIQTGMGRSGRWFAHQHESIEPDVMTLAKGLGNGVPIGACLARGKAAELFAPGSHGSTFGGNPLACSASLAVVETIARYELVARAGRLGGQLRDDLHERLGHLDGVREIRGTGLMLGIELDRPCAALVEQALSRGLLINVTAETVVRLLPPLVLSDEEAERLVDEVASLITGFLTAGDASE